MGQEDPDVRGFLDQDGRGFARAVARHDPVIVIARGEQRGGIGRLGPGMVSQRFWKVN